MAFVTKIKWVVLSVVTLSVASIILHLSFAKFWSVNIVQYGALPGLPEDFASKLGRPVSLYRHKSTVYYVYVFCFLFKECYFHEML